MKINKYLITLMLIVGTILLLKFTVKNDKTMALYIDNELTSYVPSKNDNLYIDKIHCDNAVDSYWDNENWGLFISNLSKKTKCNLYFIHDTEKPYWQIEKIEKTSVLSTDIITIKISGNDTLGSISSTLDVNNLSFLVNDILRTPVKVEIDKDAESTQKITYIVKVHMVGGEGSLKLKISSNTLTDTSGNQNDEISLDTGITVSKNPAKILHYYSSSYSESSIYDNINTINTYYSNVTHVNSYTLANITKENFDVVFLNFAVWSVPTIANDIFNSGINLFSLGNDTGSSLNITKTASNNIGVGTSNKIVENELTKYMANTIAGDDDNQSLIKFEDNVTVLYANTTNSTSYDSIGYTVNNNKMWLHSQIYSGQNYIIPIIEFILNKLK